ncbi:TPA: sigma-E factor regulatory protein RseB [Klebsiella pneumoniae]|nr:sigma-E factor regulatory protein RseB [Klebsiella pneumoniae]
MKQLWCAMSLMAGSLLFSVNASADTSSGALLQQMNLASQSLNYELSFVSISKQGVESLRYRHARLNNQPLAQLLQLDGPRREVVLRGTEISYFEPGLDPFTLNGDYIVDSLPSLVYSDFKRLSAAYDFISVGRTRIADRLCDVIRVVARDGTRYSFIAWLDAETKLPLRVDLLDRDGETLEQFRVVSFNVGDNVSASMETLAKANLPPQLSVPEGGDKANFNWAPTWLPQGVTEVSSSQRRLPTFDGPVESRLYSDGLFSFSININRATAASSDQLLRTGRRTVSTTVRDNAEITVVGELPPQTAKRISDIIQGSTMIKEWATVVSWHNGVAQVHCDVKASCSSCASRAGCGSRVLNKLGPQTSHTISVPCEQPLAAGQKVELGIAESSLLGSAMLVYMAPLAGLFVMASIFQVLFASDIASLCGALLGGVGGFLVARGLSPRLAARQSWQPVILNVALPPDLLRVDTPSSDMGQ